MTTTKAAERLETLRRELVRVTGDKNIEIHSNPETGAAVVGWSADGTGDVYGEWFAHGAAQLVILRTLPDHDGVTEDWTALRIPRFDD